MNVQFIETHKLDIYNNKLSKQNSICKYQKSTKKKGTKVTYFTALRSCDMRNQWKMEVEAPKMPTRKAANILSIEQEQ